MPRKYIRKPGSGRGQWAEEDLREAIKRIKAGDIKVSEAVRYYGVPRRTLHRRLASGNLNKGPMGPSTLFGEEHEKRLVRHIKTLGEHGFSPDRKSVRAMAFHFAEKLGIKHNFNREKQLAGYAWLESFLARHPDLSVRQAEGLSLSRAQGMNREEVKHFFNLLEKVYSDNDLINKPNQIFNVDESGLQLNNPPGKVIASKGRKVIHNLTFCERGENISVIACCNAEGLFLPPVLVMKGKRMKAELAEGLPPGGTVYMNEKSSFITSELFFKWLKEHFVPRKPPGKTLVILDGHSSHCNDIEMLQFANQNNIILVCLPSHTTQALQPLDRSFFKPLKHYFKQETETWMRQNKERKLTRYQAGDLIGRAWSKAATVQNGISGFKASGIFPFDPNAIPDCFFSIHDQSTEVQKATASNVVIQPSTSFEGQKHAEKTPTAEQETQVDDRELGFHDATLGTSKSCPSESNASRPKRTPSKFLHDISPVPVIPERKSARKQLSAVLNSPETLERKGISSRNPKAKHQQTTPSKPAIRHRPKRLTNEKKTRNTRAKGNDLDFHSVSLPSDNSEDVDTNCCTECWENYYTTTQKTDWIKCITCKKWLHETCTLYANECNDCGRRAKRAKVGAAL